MRRAMLALAVLALGACDKATVPAPSPTATATGAAPTEAMRAYDEAVGRMHGTMGAADANPDVAFARGMVAHHKGAIEMANVELRYGTDPEMRALAKAVIAAQGPEIAIMERWLARRPKASAPENAAPHAH